LSQYTNIVHYTVSTRFVEDGRIVLEHEVMNSACSHRI